MSRHRARSGRRTGAVVVSGVVVLAAATAIGVVGLRHLPTAAGRPAGAGTVLPTSPTTATPQPPTSSTRAPASTSAAATTPTPVPTTRSPADAALARLVASRSHSSTSVAAYDTVTGASVQVGATSGMTTASAAKLQLLESLLLQHQRRDAQLSSNELDTVTDMIEHSDNDAADAVFSDIGGRDEVVGLEADLGLSTTGTVAGPGDLWGLTRTSAGQQLALLRNLVDPDSPLDAARRALALKLMRNVEGDQDWGVPVVASKGTRPAVKNGWLAVGSDDNLWAVNSLGVVTVDGHTVLIAVLTQHGPSYAAGITRVESLARAAAASVGE